MKFNSTRKSFEPFNFTITIENIEEAELLFHLFNMSTKSVENMHGIKLSDNQKTTHMLLFNGYQNVFDGTKHNKSRIPVMNTPEIDTDSIPAEKVFPDNTSSKRLRGLRFRDGLTQTQVGKVTGIHFSDISKMERGIIRITEPRAKLFAKLFNVSPKIFLD